jgi:hypothetical protein
MFPATNPGFVVVGIRKMQRIPPSRRGKRNNNRHDSKTGSHGTGKGFKG